MPRNAVSSNTSASNNAAPDSAVMITPLDDDPDGAREFSCFECIGRLAKNPRAFCVEAKGTGKRCGPCSGPSNHGCTGLLRTPDMVVAFNELYEAAMKYDSSDKATHAA